MNLQQCEEKLQLLMRKYGVEASSRPKLMQRDGIFYLEEQDGEIPLLPWRQERRFTEMHALKNSGRAGLPTVLRSQRLVERNRPLAAELLRELDLCQWLMDSTVKSVCAFSGGTAWNIIVTLESQAVCTIELACALEGGQPMIDRHEINTRRGVICDRVVDTQLPQSSLYVFTSQGRQEFNDLDFELYGLMPEEVSLVREAFVVLRDSQQEERRNAFAQLKELEKLVYRSAEQAHCLAM